MGAHFQFQNLNFSPRSDVCEQQAKEAKIRAAKAEEEVMINDGVTYI